MCLRSTRIKIPTLEYYKYRRGEEVSFQKNDEEASKVTVTKLI
jgi:hypothetical protein